MEYDFFEENLNKDILDDIDELFNIFVDDYDRLYTQPEPPILISDICFPKHTLIHTDQGEVMIKNINPKIHTIHNKKIKAITKTISPDDYLVCFEKHSIQFNYPSKQTIMSKNHKIKYNGELLKAHTFLKKYEPGIYKIKYNGEILYNVLMEEYTTLKVHNLVCETLNPTSIIGLIYNNMDKYMNKLKPYPKPCNKMKINYLN